ncbi:MAG: peptide ABC transporter substrate-binding protein [Verrucomicrobia bacterium]|nr:peptide ABC transporter substrate-binding protein [Verrucomicrobiota bacterium]
MRRPDSPERTLPTRPAGACQRPRGGGLFRTAALGIAAALALLGCGSSPPSADLVILNGAEPESLDPAIMTAQADLRIGGSLFEGLTRFDPVDGNPVPGLAERWEISEDGRVYLFHLRPQAVWSTGGSITADDFVYSWRRVLDPATGSEYAGILFYLEHAEAYHLGQIADPGQIGVRTAATHRLEVRLRDPTPFFLDLCALPTLAVVPRDAIERHGDRWLLKPPVPVSGAYELVTWRINDRIRLSRNPRYWEAARTRNQVVDLLPCISASTALNLYETKAVDIVWDKNLVPVDLLDLLLARPDFHAYPVLGTYFLRFNVTRPPFNDARVRRAFAMAIDKQRIVTRITRGGEQVAHSYTPPGIGGYRNPEGLSRQPEVARQLLAEAGFPGGTGFPRFEYLFDTSSRLQEQIAVELQVMWQRELGVRSELRKMEWKTYLVAQGELDYDVCRSSWMGDYNDPNTFLDMFMSHNGNNRTGWQEPRYDQLMRQANAQVDPLRREQLLQQAETILIREAVPIVPLYFYTGLEYYDPDRIEGIYPNIRAEHPLRVIARKPALP